ncbi:MULTISPECIES: hypothetical protein [unclassified Amycolatopsis]|uniref:hypothetical protein n=1 Tax=unclassified Amycolatopsis TaxID=2618356 RepID=UPI001FF5BBBA|nr:hypothetical protein [Amycolatopsis sp. FBCC-B4732]UOX88366.1 hypothetical protein MUY14_42915 [Amycolatopsis sp. FBCC-B4732]
MEIHCGAGRAFRTVALAFTIGAVLGGGVVGYAAGEPSGQSDLRGTTAPAHAIVKTGVTELASR